MSRKSPPEFSELFKRSPTPESPAELDERILDYARRNIPAPTRGRQPLWLAAAATLSVACFGVLVVLRSGNVAPPETLVRQAAPAARIADSQNMRPVSSVAEKAEINEVLAAISQTEPEHEASEQQLVSSGRSAADAKTELAYTQSPAKKRSRAQAFSSAMQQQEPSVPSAPIPENIGATALDKAVGMAAPQSLEQATVEEALLDSDRKPQAAARHTKFKVDNGASSRDDVRKELREIKRLYADGKKNEAKNAYRKLRERCEECELPESLKKALEELDIGLKK